MLFVLESLLLLPYLFGFFLFGVGLNFCGQFLGQNGSSMTQSIYSQYQVSLRPLRFVVAIIVFSGICNAILICPSVIEMVFEVSSQSALILHQIAMAVLSFFVIFIVGVGVCSVLNTSKLLPTNIDALRISKFCRVASGIKTKSVELGFIALACSSYFYNSIFSNSIIYDMGLYHLPFVKHLVRFGPEIGLANLHDRYAIYNIQLFGQAPTQGFSFGQAIIEPSLNILFLLQL